jgi:hypothetical protein
MESEIVINAVKQRPVLFESSRNSYKDAERKSRAWKEVAAELLVDGRLIWVFCSMFVADSWILSYYTARELHYRGA